MGDLVTFFLKASMIQVLLFGAYWFIFRKSKHHLLNRYYLGFSLFLSFVIPFVELPELTNASGQSTQNEAVNWLYHIPMAIDNLEMVPVASADSTWDVAQYIFYLYIGIATILLIRSLIFIIGLRRLKRHSEIAIDEWFKLFKIPRGRPFSFFSNIFIPGSIFGTKSFDQILAHECVHVRQHHSLDRIIVDFVVSLFWFNPFIYLYRNAFIEIHEYLADEEVVRQFQDPVAYQETLFFQLQSAQYSGLVSHFNFSLIKKRIVMMNTKKKMSGWVYSLTLPVVLSVVLAFANKETNQSINIVGEEITSLLGPLEIIETPEVDILNSVAKKQQLIQDQKPSILPLKKTKEIKMTSGFGMRIDPFTKTEKFHSGIDFRCPLGTEVMAAGDGTVEEIRDNPNGYGKSIVLNHGGEYKTRYSQLGSFKVEEGQTVKRGEVIALSGNSGRSTAPHLHYEVIEVGEGPQDPVDFIKDYEFSQTTNITPDPDNESLVLVADSRGYLVDRSKTNEILVVAERDTCISVVRVSSDDSMVYLVDGEITSREDAEVLDPKEIKTIRIDKTKGALEEVGAGDDKIGVVFLERNTLRKGRPRE